MYELYVSIKNKTKKNFIVLENYKIFLQKYGFYKFTAIFYFYFLYNEKNPFKHDEFFKNSSKFSKNHESLFLNFKQSIHYFYYSYDEIYKKFNFNEKIKLIVSLLKIILSNLLKKTQLTFFYLLNKITLKTLRLSYYKKNNKNFKNKKINNYLNNEGFNKLKQNKFEFSFVYKLISTKNLFVPIFSLFKNFILPFTIFLILFSFSFFFYSLSFFKIMGVYILIGLMFFWLFSTFNFFLKRYKFSKYTSAIQRFWKRAFMCFWLIEGFLFSIFFYYLINASNEPFFIYDTYGLYINQLNAIKTFLTNSFLIVLLINVFVFLLINIKFTSLKKNSYIFLVITFIYLYILMVEFYQFYYLLNFYSDYIWNFSEDENVWELDYDIPRTRTKNHYITLLMLAKFWHYLFIFVCWVFFLVKTIELNRIRYAFLSMNFQNIILFYIMNWLCLYAWFKWIFRRFFDQTYYWFFTSFRPSLISVLVNDVTIYFKNLISFSLNMFKRNYNQSFLYLSLTNKNFYGQSSFFKFFFKSAILY